MLYSLNGYSLSARSLTFSKMRSPTKFLTAELFQSLSLLCHPDHFLRK
jgi:hypothetical protein